MTKVPSPDPRPVSWPAAGWEKQTWVSSAAWGVDAERTGAHATYSSAVPPEIRALTPAPSPEAAAAAHSAAHELGSLDGELGTRVATFAPVLLRSEAASSSQIEDITASARAIFTAELGADISRNARLITANTRAMTTAIELADEISASSIARMHEVLMADQPRHTPGRWREEAVWIGSRSDSPVGAEFVAPHHARIPALIDDLTAFAQRPEIAPLVAVAIAHAQFETVHPFTDGNGRTGRALAQSMLRARGITRSVAVPVSAGLLADVEGYHRALTSYRAGDVSPIVVAFADATRRAVGNTRELVEEMDAIREGWEKRLTLRRSSNAWRLLDVLLRHPVIDASTAATELGLQAPNVYPPLKALADAGILISRSEYRMGTFWRSPELLDAIDRFAERAGRREARGRAR